MSARTAALVAIAASQLLALSLWFSATAVSGALAADWEIGTGGAQWLTLAVQLGFAGGAFALSVLGLADIFPARILFAVAATLGAAANAALVVLGPQSLEVAIGLRLATGALLAGVYPVGIKVMSGWFERDRGFALGILVGALTLGSALPYLLRGTGADWRAVLLGASVLATAGAVIMWLFVRDGPHEVPPQRFSWSHLGKVVGNRGARLATYGYLGHMWELYAMWAGVAAFVAAATGAGALDQEVGLIAFAVIGAGAFGAAMAGRAADRLGRTQISVAALAVSGSCALLAPVTFALPLVLMVAILIVWGVSVIADSAQFSAMLTEEADPETRGSALALQTALGFLLTVASIELTRWLADEWGWRWAFPVLAIGPLLGIYATLRLQGLRRTRVPS